MPALSVFTTLITGLIARSLALTATLKPTFSYVNELLESDNNPVVHVIANAGRFTYWIQSSNIGSSPAAPSPQASSVSTLWPYK
ncbi:hypothetical protein CPB83DRAFT_900960 [Crepidotus variabilis]|uniref:Uncharacterized protein n=1 Tax=Crepidotus variabilis TaxID=179855 RepID=A0A9P6BC38_9AGAR|nr:hypothetical protein CPB83DRAFT_900960 [Crepidotus variabilis]